MIEYNLKIDGVKVTDDNNFKNVVKQVDFTIVGTDQNQSFSLPGKMVIETFDQENFVSFENLTEQQVKTWVEDSGALDSYKSHIALVVARMVAEAQLQSTSLPWAPPAPTTPPEATPPLAQ